jgi:two-component system sensor kinase FixL
MQDGVAKGAGIIIRTSYLADHEIEVSVHDHGPGVPAQLQTSIFDPFVTTKPDGLGVGLAISRTIIRAHDGDLFCRTTPGGGATFGFNLPAAEIEVSR